MEEVLRCITYVQAAIPQCDQVQVQVLHAATYLSKGREAFTSKYTLRIESKSTHHAEWPP